MGGQRNLDLGAALAEAEKRFVEAHPSSGRRHDAARKVMPGGNTRTVIYYPPFPVTIARGEGCYVWDLDGTFDFVPVALLLGVPLMFKRLELGEGPTREELRYETKMYVYKLMTTPGMGLPLTWNQNGDGTPLPPIAVCRSDGEPFTSQVIASDCL